MCFLSARGGSDSGCSGQQPAAATEDGLVEGV